MRYPPQTLPGILCAILFAGAGHLRADELEDRIKALREGLLRHAEERREEAAKSGTPGIQSTAQHADLLARLTPPSGAEPENPGALVHTLRELRNLPNLPPELKAIAESLAADLPKLEEERAEKRIAEVDRLVKAAGAACLAAKSEAELDPCLLYTSDAADE